MRPLGTNKKIKIDVRLVTASNKDLEVLAKEDKFRQDLYFRIAGINLRLPPLRERTEDIPLLVDYLIHKISKEFKLKPSEVSDQAFRVMMEYPWPGNVRQLEGVVRTRRRDRSPCHRWRQRRSPLGTDFSWDTPS